MIQKIVFTAIFILIALHFNILYSQEENKNILSGELTTDQRFLYENDNAWVWNENRLSLNLDKKISDKLIFHSEVWLRNFGLPAYNTASNLYNKGIIDPYDIELREAYIQINRFLFENLDLKIGRQRIAWGKADKLNPTDNLNPYDFEDILDFGRHRGSDALSLDYYLNEKLSLHGVYIPFYQPANLPVGIFSDLLTQTIELPEGLTLMNMSDSLILPKNNLAESSVTGLKFKGMIGSIDFSVSYVWGRDGLPHSNFNTIIPIDLNGGVHLNSELSFSRTHIFGADLAGNLRGVGLWAEAAGYIPDSEVKMSSDLSALYPTSPIAVIQDSVLLKREMYTKFILGADYNFANGSYLNVQYLHGFVHEQGNENLNDYFFLNFDMKFFESKLKIRPVGGGIIISDWKDISNNRSFVYIPEIAYRAADDAEIILSTAIFDGKGSNIFSGFSDKNMVILKLIYNF